MAVSSAMAEEMPIKFMATMDGKCILLEVNQVDWTRDCRDVIISTGYYTNRAFYMIAAPKLITLSGETPSSPKFDDQRLDITVINLQDEDRVQATGQCIKTIIENGSRISCDANSSDSSGISVKYIFETTGSPKIAGDVS